MIEDYAMSLAKKHFEADGYTIEVIGKPYDLHCRKAQKTLYVEVKGTQTEGEDILLTPNEVLFAEGHRDQMALFVVRDICIVGTGGHRRAEGGVIEVRMHWQPDRKRLTPICYSYRLGEKAMRAKTSI